MTAKIKLPEHYWLATKCLKCGKISDQFRCGCSCSPEFTDKQKIIHGLIFKDGNFRSIKELEFAGYDLNA